MRIQIANLKRGKLTAVFYDNTDVEYFRMELTNDIAEMAYRLREAANATADLAIPEKLESVQIKPKDSVIDSSS